MAAMIKLTVTNMLGSSAHSSFMYKSSDIMSWSKFASFALVILFWSKEKYIARLAGITKSQYKRYMTQIGQNNVIFLAKIVLLII